MEHKCNIHLSAADSLQEILTYEPGDNGMSLKELFGKPVQIWDKYIDARQHNPQCLPDALCSILVESPSLGYILITTYHKSIAKSVAERMILNGSIDALLESKPAAVYFAGLILDDELSKEKARKHIVESSAELAYHLGREYGDKTLRDYAREKIAREIFPE